ncbi:MAG: D-alanyl-D-alanine carboxypeptidase [Deltaproteobacteria bacterium]|jgi:D-alanyl-D-alanine carboxypeptidase|nr:D-alanyl-D-alanine carboxypeptidase [Deltaproteobacteria bacterium]
MGCLVLYWNNVPKVKWRHDDKTLKGLAGLAKNRIGMYTAIISRTLEPMREINLKAIPTAFFLLAVLLIIFPFRAGATGEITARSYLLVEKESLEIISGRNYHEELPPASTTKVMTTILALERLSGAERITADRKVRSIPASKMNLLPGRSYQASDLIVGTMVESANDAAYTLAVAIAGSEENFADMMNEKAREIGALNTHFRNASGLYVGDHYSTCWDLALIFRYALSNEQFREIVSQKYFFFKSGKQDIRYANHNRLLFCFEPSIGGKTGFTRVSQHCYVGAFEKNGRVYILALLGSKNLWGDAVQILSSLYERVPTKTELSMAKAGTVTFSSYQAPPSTKTQTASKTSKKTKRSKSRTRSTR